MNGARNSLRLERLSEFYRFDLCEFQLHRSQVRNSESTWRETKKSLRKDHRWELVEMLDREEKEKLFETHIEILVKKNKEMFHKLLDETEEVSSFRYPQSKKLSE